MALSVWIGTFGIDGYAPDPLAPFWGFQGSSIGREWAVSGLEEYVEVKAINGLPA
jgi:aldehyde dehydrogenase (NAD+)